VTNAYGFEIDLSKTTKDFGRALDGRVRLPCPEDPLMLKSAPLGMYHCPVCGEMQVAGLPHGVPDEDYEGMTGMEWPAGYVGPAAEEA